MRSTIKAIHLNVRHPLFERREHISIQSQHDTCHCLLTFVSVTNLKPHICNPLTFITSDIVISVTNQQRQFPSDFVIDLSVR